MLLLLCECGGWLPRFWTFHQVPSCVKNEHLLFDVIIDNHIRAELFRGPRSDWHKLFVELSGFRFTPLFSDLNTHAESLLPILVETNAQKCRKVGQFQQLCGRASPPRAI